FGDAAFEGDIFSSHIRLRDLMDQFCSCLNEADVAFVTDVYAAGEAPIEGVSQEAFVAGAAAQGHRDVRALKSFDDLPKLIAAIAEKGDYVVMLGAGDITKYANGLADALAKTGKSS
ncbi:MAG: UDP-N-acetylmuramate--L-alanine ligase, partial [Pseudomonadota bacterium]